MIPKIIHYCWFGKEMPDKVKLMMSTWIEHLWYNGYKLMFWNKNSIDKYLGSTNVKYMIENELWAFLSDYIRCRALYEYGGIYIDTDVILCDSFDKILHLNTYLGLERVESNSVKYTINNKLFSGAIMGTLPNNELFKKAYSLMEQLPKEKRVLIGEILGQVVQDNFKYRVVDSINEAKIAENDGYLALFNAPTFDSFPSKKDNQDYDICDHIYTNLWVTHEVFKK